MPEAITTETQLEERLSRPTQVSREAMRQMQGDLLILGAGGKMGPSLARLARRSADEVGRRDLKVVAVSRFSNEQARRELQAGGVETICCDLLDDDARRRLPMAPNVLFMFGHKFSEHDLPGMYWMMNVVLPGVVAEQYSESRIVCFSSGNVYPFTPLGEPEPTEETPPAPLGEYATTVFGRERLLQYASARFGTPVCLLRLNYAVEPRYGVLVDLAEKLLAGQTIDLGVPEANIIWQAHANAVALGCFQRVASPAAVLNVTGLQRHKLRDLADGLAQRLGLKATFTAAGPTALVSDAALCHEWFGPPEIDAEGLLDQVADWLQAGGRTLGKPTKFQVRDGKY